MNEPKSIIQCDKNGTPIQEWASVNKACIGMNLNRTQLDKALKEKKEFKGFLFVYKTDMPDVGELPNGEDSPQHGKSAPGANVPREIDDDKIVMSKADLERMLGDVENRILARVSKAPSQDNTGEMKEIIADLADSLNPSGGYRTKTRFEASIDREDYLDKPVRFFTYRNYFSIHSETRYSHEVKTPYGRPIIFKNISGHVTGGSTKSGKQTVQIAAADIYTKKELAWMKASPMFNVVFFEKVAGIDTIDPYKASQLAQALTEISGLSEFNMMQKAMSAGISPSTDVEEMRKQLIQLIANQNIDIAKTISRNAASPLDASMDQIIKRGVDKNQLSGISVNSY